MSPNQRLKGFIRIILLVFIFVIASDVGQWVVSQPWWESYFTQGKLKVYFLSVGQGNATLIRTPAGRNILIDAGPDLSVVYRLGEVLPFYERVIDLVVLTHPDRDHILGLVEVLNRYQVQKIIASPIEDNDVIYHLLKQLAGQQEINWLAVEAGDIFLFDGVLFKILYPTKSFVDSTIDRQDNNIFSLVIRVEFQQVAFLFSGDLPEEGELSLVNKGVALSADVLQAGHHGSKTSTSLKWLQAVKPKYVVISVGADNNFGHPHYLVLRNIGLVGAKVLRTDQGGTIEFVSDGLNVWQE